MRNLYKKLSGIALCTGKIGLHFSGLVIGWKSLKNYATHVVSDAPNRPVNPSIATLDTLARYVCNALLTSEGQRKKGAADYPYWFRYKEQFRPTQIDVNPALKQRIKWPYTGVVLALLVMTGIISFCWTSSNTMHLVEDFHVADESYLQKHGWILQARDAAYWDKRGATHAQLTLFTIQGDNWPKTGETPVIRNLLLQKIKTDCFATEIQLTDFVPHENWQQAGLILLEDTTYTGKSIRLSLSYNDFFGGYTKPGEIIVQAIASQGKAYTNLEEMVHRPLFSFTGNNEQRIITNNLKTAALRIEKRGAKFQFLYATSPTLNFSFKEIGTYEFDMVPAFVGIFALKGFVDSTAVVPVAVKFFRLESQPCQ